MLEVVGLEKAFDGRPVLRGLSLRLGPADGVALMGDNGSGKTTTLRAIMGLTVVDRGRILVDGVDAIVRPVEARRRLSYMAQKAAFPDTITVREALRVVARLRGVAPVRIDEEIADCGLEAAADARIVTLSGGQRQRVALAAALLPDVGLYLFDEPSANLDAVAGATLARRVRRLRAAGRAVLFTTHVLADVAALGARIERLENGRCRDAEVERAPETDLAPVGHAARWMGGGLWRRLAGAGAGAAGSR
jgi:ABC-type multidrug transport system ATPase subunit